MGLSGQKLLGAPLIIQMTCAERNRAANAVAATNTIGELVISFLATYFCFEFQGWVWAYLVDRYSFV